VKTAAVGLDRETGELESEPMPMLLTPDEAATLLRTTRKGVYTMIARGQMPGVTHVGRRVLVRSRDLLDWLDRNCAPSPQERQR
jgi:excisionase family DNA binding protein